MILYLTLSLVFVFCVPTPTPFTMVGQDRGKDSHANLLDESISFIEQLQAVVPYLETSELQFVIENLLNENRRRVGFTEPVLNSP